MARDVVTTPGDPASGELPTRRGVFGVDPRGGRPCAAAAAPPPRGPAQEPYGARGSVVAVVRYRNPAVSVDGVWIRGNSVLLVRRRRAPFRGRLALPGGFVEYEETVEAAMAREIREETGLKGRPRGILGVYSGPDRDPRHPTTTIVFAMTGRAGRPRAGDDAADARWVPLSAARGLAFDHDLILAESLRRLRTGRFVRF